MYIGMFSWCIKQRYNKFDVVRIGCHFDSAKTALGTDRKICKCTRTLPFTEVVPIPFVKSLKQAVSRVIAEACKYMKIGINRHVAYCHCVYFIFGILKESVHTMQKCPLEVIKYTYSDHPAEYRWWWNSTNDCMALYCTVHFIITLPSSRYD